MTRQDLVDRINKHEVRVSFLEAEKDEELQCLKFFRGILKDKPEPPMRVIPNNTGY